MRKMNARISTSKSTPNPHNLLDNSRLCIISMCKTYIYIYIIYNIIAAKGECTN